MAITTPTKPPSYSPYAAPTDTVDVTPSVVNVTPFGWTSNDNTSVKDLLTYVKTAQTASESADANAKYVQKVSDLVQSAVSTVDSAKEDAVRTYQTVQDLATTITVSKSDIDQANKDSKTYKDAAMTSAGEAKAAQLQVEKLALASIYKFKEGNAVSTASLTLSADAVQHYELRLGTTTVNLPLFTADPDSTARQLTIIFKQGTGANRVNWPQGVPTGASANDYRPKIMWNGGREPVFSYVQDMEDVVTLLTTDKGIHWYGFYNGGWFNTAP